MAGIESLSVVNADGEIIRSDGPMGITMKREDERSARDLGRTGNITDLILAFAIDAETAIASPGRIRRAVMEITGLETGLTAGGVQRVSDPDSDGVRIVTVDLRQAEKTTRAEAAPWLLPGERVQSDDPRIQARAREIVGGGGTPRQKAERLFAWVHENMRQQSAFTLPSAVDVLETMTGDCNEHAVLLTALSRAAGIPARDAVGVAYHQGRFYYHAWNELWLDGYWYPIDATFNELPAGALRVRLAVGDLAEQMRIATMAGRIQIRVKEASE
jgi:transglutaminase-like putative cysteine protease